MKLEALMNQGFRKAQVHDRHTLVKEFTIKQVEMIEIYELQENDWKQIYYGHKSYVDKYLESVDSKLILYNDIA